MSSMSPPPQNVQQTSDTAFSHLVSTKYYVLASCVMLVYDQILTFEQERVYIWNRKKNIPSCLFITFRYFTLIVTLLNLVAEHDPRWTGSICRNWIWLPVSTTMITNATTGVMRVHAIYSRSKWILAVLVPVYLGELIVMGWSIPSGVPAKMPAGFVGCIPVEEPGTGRRLTAMFIAALIFDTVIFLLTLSRALFMSVSSRKNLTLLTLVVRDGTLYFMVIFVVNLVNVFLLAFATVR
ncbi:hypothetical protein F5887DRAFT_973811 [Amanita rubescens]|nr:hypothetical protein F5887DRAFT_987958 [Amanita rubescens]KAF8343208.1 hypothetical protein F5887DRAFT_973811 [Amanita rubescens]